MRHGTFEIKLMVLVETQRSVEMTTDVVRAERGSAFCIRVLSWFTSNGSTSAKSFSWSWLRGLAMFCMQYSLILYQTVMKQAVLLYPLTKDFILFAWWSSVLSPWIPDNGGASTDLLRKSKVCYIVKIDRILSHHVCYSWDGNWYFYHFRVLLYELACWLVKIVFMSLNKLFSKNGKEGLLPHYVPTRFEGRTHWGHQCGWTAKKHQ